MLLSLAMTLIVGAMLWSEGHSLLAITIGSFVLVTSVYAFGYSSEWIERWTGLQQVQSNRSHATHFGIAMGGLVGSDYLWPEAGYFLSMLAFMISLTLGGVLSQLCFGERKSSADAC